MSVRSLFWTFAGVLMTTPMAAQENFPLLASDELRLVQEVEDDPAPGLYHYDRMNPHLGGDSIRTCPGGPCNGWLEDRYADGTLKHKGLYEEGRLVLYRNYYPDGTLEREFRQQDAIKSVMRTYHADAGLRSEARYANGSAYRYEDHYPGGALRYAEERHRKEPYFLRMDLHAPNGDPISLLRLVDRKRMEFELKEFHPGGRLKSEGRARYDPFRQDTKRVGIWKYYDADGSLLQEEEYIGGKAHR